MTISVNVEKAVGEFNDLEQYLLEMWGREGRPGWRVITEFIELGKKYGKEKLYDAIKTAALYNVRTYAYVNGILKNKTGNKPVGKPIQEVMQTLGFISVVCCEEQTVRKIDLVNNQDKHWTCGKCKRSMPVKEMLKRERDGKIKISEEEETPAYQFSEVKR